MRIRFKTSIIESSTKAYMIRNDGKIFTLLQHVYGNYNDYDETCAAAEWLYSHTQYNEVKNDCVKFISTYAEGTTINEKYNYIIDAINTKPYKFLSIDFIDSIKHLLTYSLDLDDYNKLICEEVNQEFLRARYGGMYNSFSNSREMVFRISSYNFNWFNIIWQFVYDNRNIIDTVTIVKDEEATGAMGVYYSHGGCVFDNLPVEDFINLSGNPILEKLIATSVNHDLLLASNIKHKNLGRLLSSYYRSRFNELTTF